MKVYIGMRNKLGYRQALGAGREVRVWEKPPGSDIVKKRVLDIEISRKLIDHSNEFNWSYGGSGPAQLALAILLDMWGDPHMALSHYQRFKEDKVAKWEGEWKITGAQIDEWLAKECGVL